mgnify:FL=1
MKKKTKENIFKVFVIILFFISIFSIIMPRALGNYDELWNFNFANQMANGLIPYKDFNMIQTPLMPMVCSIFLKIFGQELIVMRVLAVILNLMIFYVSYKILSYLKVSKPLILGTLISIFLLLQKYMYIDYNLGLLLILLLIIYLELRKTTQKLELHIKYDILIGILSGLCFTLKQSIGMVAIIAIVGYQILKVKNKNDLILFIKIALFRVLGALIPIAILLVYLICNNALKDFISYALLGIGTFSNNIPYTRLIFADNKITFIFSILVPILLIIMLIITLVKRRKVVTIFTVFSLTSFLLVFPISDEIHFYIGIVPILIYISYLISRFLRGINWKNRKKKKYIFLRTFLSCVIILSSIYFGYMNIKKNIDYFRNMDTQTLMNGYKYITMSEYTKKKIEIVDNFILSQNKPVYILDAEAVLFRIPINQYYKDYDMFLKGNLGKDGEEGQIQKLEADDNKIILIRKDTIKRNWQNPEEVRKYVKENYTKVGSISIFDIYE